MGGRGANSFQRGNYKQMLKIRKLDGADYEVYQGGNVKGIEQVTIYGRGEYTSRDVLDVLNGGPEYYGARDTLSQTELNNSPVAIMTYRSRDFYIFNSKAEMDRVIKNVYGGYSQIGQMGKDYGIMSAAGKGEYYLQRDKYAKGGSVWVDADNIRVKGYEPRKRQSDETYRRKIRRKVYGEE